MKARVKATGEIVEVTYGCDFRESKIVELYTNIEDPNDVFEKEELEFLYDSEFIDYWERLKHQAAISAMQGILTHMDVTVPTEWVAEEAEAYATALVEKLKGE